MALVLRVGVEKQEGSLTTRLKVRQWTQMLVDHSLLLGSSSEGIHLHDIVLQYLRKRLSAEEMRAEQTKVVEEMVAVSKERLASTGSGYVDTGSTARPFDGKWLGSLDRSDSSLSLAFSLFVQVKRSIGMYATSVRITWHEQETRQRRQWKTLC